MNVMGVSLSIFVIERRIVMEDASHAYNKVMTLYIIADLIVRANVS